MIIRNKHGKLVWVSFEEIKRRRYEVRKTLDDRKALKECLIEFLRRSPFKEVHTFLAPIPIEELIKEVEMETELGRKMVETYRRMLEEMMK